MGAEEPGWCVRVTDVCVREGEKERMNGPDMRD